MAQIGLRWPREIIVDRIETRVHQMVEAGLFAEVEAVRSVGFSKTSSFVPGSSLCARSDGSVAIHAYAGLMSKMTQSPRLHLS